MKLIIHKILYIILLTPLLLAAQNDYAKKYITLKPGAAFEANWTHEVVFGAHWRDIWNTPIKVEILDLDKFAGGLSPIKRGGGKQTKSLRLMGKDGNIWKFRSMSKYPGNVLPEELRNSIASDILQDQISSANPMAPLVVAEILDSVGIIHNRPYLVYMPDDEKLKEFKEEFGDMLGLIEIHPDVDKEMGIEYRGAEDIKTTYKLLNRLEEKRNEQVDSKEFFKARLVDIFIGDWDRHADQWKWAKYNENGKKVWKPIPRDRDQAFSKFDGALPTAAEYMVQQLVTFDEDYSQIEDLTWNGRFLDRRFLIELNRPTWDSLTLYVKSRLTDETLVNAFNNLPPEIYEQIYTELIDNLKSRRDNLFEASDEYYLLLNEVVEIYGSTKNDFVEVNRLDDERTEVGIYKRDKQTNEKEGAPLFYRIFDNEITYEIRIHLLDGDDKVVLKGEVDSGPLIRVIGGDGKDELEDNSIVNGYWLNFTPIPDAENKTIFYDSGKKTKIEYAPGTVYNREKISLPENDEEKYENPHIDRSYDWQVYPIINLDSDNGFILGGAVLRYNYDFRAKPYDNKIQLSAVYATLPQNGTVRFDGEFFSLINNASVNLEIIATGLAFTKYYGYGNETSFSLELEENDFYRQEQRIFSFFPGITYALGSANKIFIGASFNISKLTLINENLLSTFTYGDYGTGEISAIGLHVRYELDLRDVLNNPHEGIYLKLTSGYFPGILGFSESFMRAGFDLRWFYTIEPFYDLTFALRTGGEKVWGKYPFYASAYLGGGDNLRGYSRERFSGDASIFGQAEIRAMLTRIKLFLVADFGMHIFGETGRVFALNEISDKWHPSYGGGFWLSYFNRTMNVSLTFASSVEKNTFYFTLGMMF